MEARERVIETIRRGKLDRIPVYGWVAANLSEPITEQFGSVAAFEDHYEFDYAHLFGGPLCHKAEDVEALQAASGGAIDPLSFSELAYTDPDDSSAYQDIIDQVRQHKEERGRFVYVQTPGIFEALNGVFGIENHLMYLLMYMDEIQEVYARQAAWNKAFAMNCLDLGVDMIHVSDDWGGQQNLLFSVDTWWSHIYPYHKITADAVKARGAFLSLHTDGNINSVIDGIIKLGFDVVHPWQESAGMSLKEHREKYIDHFVTMGGLDVQTTIGFEKYDYLQAEIERVLQLSVDGGQLYCTSHFVQDHCSMEELCFAFDLIYRLVRELGTT